MSNNSSMSAIINRLDKIGNTSLSEEPTPAEIGNAANTAYTASGLGQLGAMGAKAAKFAPGVAKLGAKFVPGLGAVAGAADAARRASAGDYAGAALSGAAGAASSIPVVGTAASMGLTAIQALRDKYKTGSWLPDYDEIKSAATTTSTPTPTQPQPGKMPANSNVAALQNKLIAAGANIKADGIMGPKTQEAMQQYGITAESLNSKGNIMTEAEKIAALRNQLDQLDEGPLDAIKSGWNAVKNTGQAAKVGFSGKPVPTGVLTPTGKTSMVGQGSQRFKDAMGKTPASQQAAYKTGQVVGNNKGKLGAAAGAAAGAAGMAALRGQGAAPTPTPPKPAPNAPPQPKPVPPGVNQKDMSDLDQLAYLFSNAPDLDQIASSDANQLLQRYEKLKQSMQSK